MFKHFLITRFNLVYNIGVFKKDKKGQETHTSEWLEARFDLFEKFCFPSVVNQTNNNFYWVVLFSANTPEKYKKKIADYSNIFKKVIPLYLEDGADNEWGDNLDKTRTEISKHLDSSDQHIITSRIDNDDAFHKNMIKCVQDEFAAQDDLFLSFDTGLQYDMEQGLLSRLVFPSNAFISRIEKIKNGHFATVFATAHVKAHLVAKVRHIDTYPLWLQLIHAGNIHNWFRTNDIMSSSKSVSDFNIKIV
jgi:ribosomal protein L30E